MAGYLPLKMKRKDLDDVNDEFSDFSLSSPARKIRRLDAELPPIMEEEEPEVVPVVFEQSMSEANLSSTKEREGGPVIEELPSSNEERSIVLFKPMSTPLLQSPSNFSIQVSSDLISGFKNQVRWSNESNPVVKLAEDEAARKDHENAATKESLAVVPWVPSQFPPTQNEVSELMETEEMEVATMDIEDDNTGMEHGQGNEFGGTSVSDSLHQWPSQQHCVIPQFPQNPSTPVVWYR